MPNLISISDYAAEWAIKDYHVEPRTQAGYLDREEVVAFLGTLEIDGVELSHGYWADYDIKRLKQLADDAGAVVFSYVGIADLAVPPPELQKSVDVVFMLLDRAAALGARSIFLLPELHKQDLPLENERAWLIEGLGKVAERAQAMQLTILCENIDYPPMRPLMGRGSQCRDLCATVNSPAFRLIYDAAAPLFVGEDAFQTLEEMGPYVGHVHVKNFRKLAPGEPADRYLESDDGSRYTGTTLDAGVISIAEILQALRKRDYNGTIQIEYQGVDDPRVALKHNVAYLRNLFG